MKPTKAHNNLAFSFTHATLGYGEQAILRDVNLQVNKGEVVALMGGSGCGKTTLLRTATGQIPALSGCVELLGQSLSECNAEQLKALRRRMGVLFQQGALFTDLNVFENVAFPLRELTSDSESTITEKVLTVLEQVGLKAAAHLSTSEISGGMARRVALARTIIMKPEVIFFDEPFAGLDPISLGIIAKLIRELTDDLGCASLVITHDIEETFAISDHALMVGQGRVLASGTPSELRASTDPYVQQFLSARPDGPVSFTYPEGESFYAWHSKKQSAIKRKER